MADIAKQVLGPPLWLGPEVLAALAGGDARGPFTYFIDNSYTTKWDPNDPAYGRCIRITPKRGNGDSLRLIASLQPVVAGRFATYLTDDLRPIFLLQTDASRHEDGTIQIYGAEPGLAIFTVERMQSALRKNEKLIDTDSVGGFSIERRASDGTWTGADFPIVLSRKLFREVQED